MNTAISNLVWETAATTREAAGLALSDLRAFSRPYAELDANDRECWAELTRQAASTNIFAHDWFMDAALASSGRGEEIELLVVASEEGRWLGVLPIVSERKFGRWPIRTFNLWSATNQFLLTPLVLPQFADTFWQTALLHMDRRGDHSAFYCRLLAANDAVDRTLADVCGGEGRPFYLLNSYDRAARLAGAADSGRQVSRKSRRKLESRLRNLSKRLVEQHGELDMSLHPDGQAPDDWIDAFLALERTGWKGRAGSALACDGDTEALFRAAIRTGSEMGLANLATLKAGGRPIAMTSWFVTGQQGFGFKMAYDEAFAEFAPGQLLMQRIAALVESQPELDFDTCSAPDSQNTKYLWPDRRELFDCVVAVGSPARRLQLRMVLALRAVWRRIREARRR
ncbi:MAG: GNAT family N-acetyltransferase [Novosphingobium sp.]|nr:GNAT family N-acetyltransferase [Novosphingobium sp.]MCP5403297.1 GNAT family N-acetyltransferase [Novosphingobium sp.]